MSSAAVVPRPLRLPLPEVAFGLVLYGGFRSAVAGYETAAEGFRLRDELFQEMAVAHTYRNSLVPWVQTGSIALAVSVGLVLCAKVYAESTKDWEQQQEMREARQMGAEALFLTSTPISATRTEENRSSSARLRQRSWPVRFVASLAEMLWLPRLGACVGYILPLLNVLDFGEISVSLYPYALGVPLSEPIVDFMQKTMRMRFLHDAYVNSGYYFLVVWFLFINFVVRNKAAPLYVRFHASQAILISMLLSVPQQIFFGVLNPWEAGLGMQAFMHHGMVSIFLFVLGLVAWCCARALLGQTMEVPLVSEAALMWAGSG